MSHTARSGHEPHTPGGTKCVLRVGGEPGKTAGPTLRGAAMSRTLEEGPNVCCGLAVNPGKPPLSTVLYPCSPSTRGRLGVSGACWLDDIRHAKSIATHNFAVLMQSLDNQLAQIDKDLEKAKADVTNFTTLPLLGS